MIGGDFPNLGKFFAGFSKGWKIAALSFALACSASAENLRPVLDTLAYLRHETDVWFEITTLLIPGHNDSDAELRAGAADADGVDASRDYRH